MYIDAHCHLERETYGDELDAVIARAFAAGVTHLVAVGSSGVSAGGLEAVALAQRVPGVFAACGIHPHEAHLATDEHFGVIDELLSAPKVVAFGEIGLDYFYDFSPQDVQREVFRRQLELGHRHDLPVMLHVRDAHEDCWQLIDEVGLPARGCVAHCFTAGPKEAEGYLARGCYLSIPGVVTFKNADDLRKAVAAAPLERLLVETDCPYLAPVPHRGKQNEPAYVVETAAAVGRLHGLSGEEAGKLTSENAKRLFRLP